VEYGKAKRRRFPCFQLNSQRNGRFAKRSIGAFEEKTSSETRNGTVKMATTAKFLRPITQSLAAITSSCPPISHSRRFCNSLSLSRCGLYSQNLFISSICYYLLAVYAKFEPLKTLIKDLEPALRNPASTFQRRLITQRKYFRFSGNLL
jgi:hypothetical protein